MKTLLALLTMVTIATAQTTTLVDSSLAVGR